MTLQSTPTAERVSTDGRSRVDTRLHGRWLLLARVVWIVLVVVLIGFFVIGLPEYVNQLYTVGNNPVYVPWQLSPDAYYALQNVGISLSIYAPFVLALSSASLLVWVVVGVVIFWRKSDDWMALLVAFVLVNWGLSTFAGSSTLDLGNVVPQIVLQAGGFLLNASIFLFFFLFPDGRFVPGWTRWPAVVVIALVVGTQFLSANSPWNPNNWPAPFSSLLLLLFFLSIGGAQLYRYRRVATAIQREQIKWVVFALTIVVFGMLGDVIVEDLLMLPVPVLLKQFLGPVLWNLLPVLIPVSIGIAILRSRLYDINIIIHRTLVYGTLTVLLALNYIGLVIGLQALVRLLTGQVSQSPVVIVASTLAIAALFGPLRHRVQRIIDRRFYRSKYDAAKTLAAFSATLRNEVDLERLQEELVAVVQETMQPAHVSLWLRKPEWDGKRTIGQTNALVSHSEE